MFFLLFCLLFFSCVSFPKANIENNSKLPVCLIVANEDKKEDVIKAINKWNDRLKEPFAFTIYPNCLPEEHREFVPLLFTENKPIECNTRQKARGCVITRRVGKELLFVEVLIWKHASYLTLLHELGHLAGCKENDFLPPCWE